MPDKPAPDLDALLRYRQKRDFERTPEPADGAQTAIEQDLTFVVQQHRATRMHWDFRLEMDGVLVSWAVPRGPSLNPSDKRMAAHVEDHPFDYGGFEGVIPKGNYGAGEVIVWDNGIYTPDEKGVYSWGNKEEGNRRLREEYEAGKISFTLRGKKLRGSWTLVRTKANEGKDWLLIKHRDEYASTRDVLEEDRSVISGLSLKDLQEGRMPSMAGGKSAPHADAREAPFPDAKTLRPMLPTLIAEPFSREGWIFEPKMDGVRVLAFVRDGSVELRSRRGLPATVQYPEIVEAFAEHRVRAAVFDGEIVALNEAGVPDLQAIQPRINLTNPHEVARVAGETPVVMYVFDILYADGYDLARVPLTERKAILWRTLEQGTHLRYVDHVATDGAAMFEASRNIGFEGTVAKRANSIYEPGVRSKNWLKVKTVLEQEFVVGGFTEGEGLRASTFGGLLVGYYDVNGDLRFASSVGSGFTDSGLDSMLERLEALRVDQCPFVNPPTTVGGRWAGGRMPRIKWVRPEIVVQVKFASWTRDGNLRAPVYLGVREDVDPRTVRRDDPARVVDVIDSEPPPEAKVAGASDGIASIAASVVEQLDSNKRDNFTIDVGGAPIKLTNLSKEFWPAYEGRGPLTKRDMIRYYGLVAPWLLPHLTDRPLTLTRYPNGIYGQSFYQKHWPSTFPEEFRIERAAVYSAHNDKDGEYILCNNIQTLIWLAQLADLEIHAWMARVNPEPDAHGLPTTFAGSEQNMDDSVLNYPDYMVFDLDPYIYAGTEKKGEEPVLNRRAFEKGREMAFSLKEILQQLRLSSFVKTTGKTGLHIYVPVLRQYTYDEIRAASATVGQYMVQMHPNDLTMEWAVEKRSGKIFFDHNQNTRGKTLAAQYSLRPVAWAGASAPVTWEELKAVYPTEFDIDAVPARLREKGDLWKDILANKQDLKALIEGL